MKKAKKVLGLLVVFCMLAAMMAGCSGTPTTTTTTATTTAGTTVAATTESTTTAGTTAETTVSGLTAEEELGKALFFDENLSANNNKSCATCHAPEFGFVGSDLTINAHGSVYEGSIPGAFGNSKPPSAAYGGDSPPLHYDGKLWIGGMFWDGSATGMTLGDPLAEQAQGPFLNPNEQALPDAAALCNKVSKSEYKDLFEIVWGPISLDPENTNTMFEQIARSIAAYERSFEVNPFTSKYDFYLKGQVKLTDLEKQGLQLFEGKAMCSTCHISTPGAGGSPLFTDFTYDNLGIPKNPENPVYTGDPNFIDLGLGGNLKASGSVAEVYEPELGKFKVPTLRNVALKPSVSSVKAYGHNGYFKSLQEIVHFYNTRDTASAGWPLPEYSETMNMEKLGNLGLSLDEENALVAFLNTLSDGFVP